MSEVWIGIDAGKAHHHCCVVDADGRRLLSRRVANDEQPLMELIAEVASLGKSATWAIDLAHGGGALLITMLINHGQRVFYLPGRVVHSAAAMYRGDGKTDARDAAVIADQARMRRDLQPVRDLDEHVVKLQMLTAYRADLSADRVRSINRLRDQLLSYFPALERAFDFASSVGSLKLLLGFRTPQTLREINQSTLTSWLTIHHVRNPGKIASAAISAAQSQHTRLAGEDCAAGLVKRLVHRILALNEELDETDQLIEQQFRQHHAANVLTSMPGFGPRLAAEFIAATGGDVTAFGTPDRLARSLVWPPHHETPGESAGTCADHNGSTAASCEPATWLHRSVFSAARNHGATTTRNALQARNIPRPYYALPDAAQTCFGSCCATTNPFIPDRTPPPRLPPRRPPLPDEDRHRSKPSNTQVVDKQIGIPHPPARHPKNRTCVRTIATACTWPRPIKHELCDQALA